MVKLFKALPALVFATFTAAQSQFAITVPSPSNWWVGQSTNDLTWTCTLNTQWPQFTVLVNNSDPAVLASPLAIIAIQDNTICSISTPSPITLKPASNYTILFANDVNNTDVFFTSQPFEIKPLGSLYPSQVTSSNGAFTGTGSVLAAPASTGTHSGALGAHTPNFIGLAGFMGLLAAALLGA